MVTLACTRCKIGQGARVQEWKSGQGAREEACKRGRVNEWTRCKRVDKEQKSGQGASMDKVQEAVMKK